MRAVLLLAFGGPRSLEEVEVFVRALLGREPPEGLLRATRERYRAIGGRSPLPEAVSRLALKLEERLGPGWMVKPAMLFSEPGVARAIREARERGAEALVGVSLSPHRSRVTAGSFARALEKEAEAAGLPWSLVAGWHAHPLFVGELVRILKQAWPLGEGEEVIFTAHSLPRAVAASDPYEGELRETVESLLRSFPPFPWRLAFQSRGPEGEWLGPPVEEVMAEWASRGGRRVVVQPVGFLFDHMETLYDLDVAAREQARKLGLHFRRLPCPGDSPAIVSLFAELVRNLRGGEADGAP